MKDNIALIGFMGTGKNSVGISLAKKLNKKFVDTDSLIEETAGRSIPEIFEENGEVKFRELEMEAVRIAADMRNVVISCGGGVVLDQINIEKLRKNSKIILLTASPDVILKRVKGNGKTRPLLERPNKLSKIKQLLLSRTPLYKISADQTIDTSELSVEKVVDKIIKDLN